MNIWCYLPFNTYKRKNTEKRRNNKEESRVVSGSILSHYAERDTQNGNI